MKSSKKAFTLVELIIVIAIIAILAVTAFLMLTKWIAKSRDTSRLSDLNTIDNALQVYLTEKNSLPKPENYTLIYANGTSNIVGYQGDFSDNVAKNLGNMTKAPKDALDNTYYNYYVDSTSTKYQLLGYTENLISSVLTTANAVDYSTRYVRIAGDKLGILTDANNAPVNKLGLTGLDIALTTGTYKSYFDSSTSVSGTGATLVSMLTLSNKNLASMDTGLVFYSDMETTINSGGLTMLKDLSSYGNNGTCYNSGTAGNCGSVGPSFVNGTKGKAMMFNGITGDYISLPSIQNLLGAGGEMTIIASVNIKSYSKRSQVVGFVNALNGGFLEAYPGTNIDSSYTNKMYYAYRINLAGTPQVSVNNSSLYNYNEFHTVAGRYSLKNQLQSMFVDGGLIASIARTQSPTLSSVNFVIGGTSTLSHVNGLIDEVRIYNRALSDDEVKTLYIAN